MFRHLTDFGLQRTTKQAFGFYIAWLLATVALGAVAGGIIVTMIFPVASYGEGFAYGVRAGNYVAVIMSLLIAFLVLRDKKMFNHFSSIALLLASGLLALLGGGLLGLIIPAYLTTRAAGGDMANTVTLAPESTDKSL